MYVGSSCLCAAASGSGRFVELLYKVFSERIVGPRQVGT